MLKARRDCARTDPGFYATTGSTTQTACSPGTVAPHASMGTCEKCVAGTYQDELGNEGKTLAEFCAHDDAVKAKLTSAEVAALRLYTGPAYKPMNKALRDKNIEPWKTTIALCASGVLKLSFLSSPQVLSLIHI